MNKPEFPWRPAKRASIHSSSWQEDSWKIFQIMAEFVEGFERLSNITPAVTLFGSARFKSEHPYYLLAEQIAKELSDAGFSIVSGGGPGIMEAANKGAFAGHSPSIGLNIDLPQEQHSNQFQDISLNFKHLFVRKVMLIKYSVAYVVLPGGFGTLDELTEVLTLLQTGKLPKVPLILVGKTFWQGLLNWFDNTLLIHSAISPEDLQLMTVVETPQEVANVIFAYYQSEQFNDFGPKKEKLF